MRTAHLENVHVSRPCPHASAVKIHQVERPAAGCEECLRTGGHWVHLRVCLTCGHVGCCDSSPGRHATYHFHQTHHPVMTSAEPGESWIWCFVDEVELSA
jgi:uncharacterized UBP type Zn finger protein